MNLLFDVVFHCFPFLWCIFILTLCWSNKNLTDFVSRGHEVKSLKVINKHKQTHSWNSRPSAATLGSALQSVAGNKSVLLRTSPTNMRPFRKNNELVSQQRHHVVNSMCDPVTHSHFAYGLTSPKRNHTEKHASCNFSCCWCSFKKTKRKKKTNRCWVGVDCAVFWVSGLFC